LTIWGCFMTNGWKVGNALVPWELASLYADARQRVLTSDRLYGYYHILLSDGYASDKEHLTWLVKGRVQELIDWAQQIRADSGDNP